MPASVRLALGQFGAELGDVGANLKQIREMSTEAADAGADLACFPELSLSGYLLDPESYTPELLDQVERAEMELAAEAERLGIALVYGAPLRDGTRLRNGVIMQHPGGVRLTYAKTHMTATERAVFLPGSEFVVEERGVALACCYDLAFPEAARILALRGARLLLVPMAWEVQRGFVMRHVVPARAVENVAYVVCVNQCGTVGEYRFRGGSCAVDPLGETCVCLGDEAGLGVVDIALDWTSRLREGADKRSYPLLDDRRVELYAPIAAEPLPKNRWSLKSDMYMLSDAAEVKSSSARGERRSLKRLAHG